jgi:hypothetical protein
VFQHDQLAAGTLGAFECHALPRGFASAHCNVTSRISAEPARAEASSCAERNHAGTGLTSLGVRKAQAD